jgi:hypothetical protein
MKRLTAVLFPRAADGARAGAKLLGFVLGLCGLVLAGCKTPETGPSSWLASVQIAEKTSAQIRVVATSIFQREGFTIASARGNEVVLEKPGGTMQNALYGGLTSGVWIRVKLRVRPYGPDAHLLECNAYRVSDKGDRAFEQEKIYRRSGSWQKLLDEVKAQLQAGA